MKSKANIVVGAVIVIIVAVAVAAMLVMRSGGTEGGLRAVVHVDGGTTHELPLSDNAELEVLTPGTDFSNTVVVEDGAVYVREANCDNQDCVHQGKLDAPGHQIICLPHKLWIEVVADGEGSGAMDTSAVSGGEGLDVVSR